MKGVQALLNSSVKTSAQSKVAVRETKIDNTLANIRPRIVAFSFDLLNTQTLEG